MENYSVERLDHFGVVAGTIKDLGLIELIDSRLESYEGETLSPGETVAGMIINGLGFANKPLSLTPLLFQNCPLSLLFRDDVKAEDFNRLTGNTFRTQMNKRFISLMDTLRIIVPT